ncbi:MAG TPA: ARMT1-like domain-containing protein [bacterium]|nr:ARMT1-like domain-containing protein [bacterium]
MRVHPQCFPCFVRQALIAASQITDDPVRVKEIIDLSLDPIRNAKLSDTPAHIATEIYRRIRARLNGTDPFRKIKARCTEMALKMVRDFEPIERALNPLESAIRTSVAGNVIDFGIYSDIDLRHVVENIMQEQFGILSLSELESDLAYTKSILFLADNAGELVFDVPLIGHLLQFGSVKVAVKSVPVINDATMADAMASGLPAGAELIENGSDCVGTILETCSDTFRKAFYDADLIISKGQANFETLDEVREANIYFLFKAKCEVTAGMVGVAKESLCAVSSRAINRLHA